MIQKLGICQHNNHGPEALNNNQNEINDVIAMAIATVLSLIQFYICSMLCLCLLVKVSYLMV